MDQYYRESRNQKPVSVLDQGDGYCINKILARESSVGQSSRIYYRGTNEGVPFNWEMEPGTPKGQPAEEVIPTPTPPPAVQSLGVPKPSLDHHTKESRRARFWFWMRSMRRQENSKRLGGKYKRSVTTSGDRAVSSDEFEGFYEFGDHSDGEFTASANNSRSSSASSSTSSNGASLGVPRFRGVPLIFCGPWQH